MSDSGRGSDGPHSSDRWRDAGILASGTVETRAWWALGKATWQPTQSPCTMDATDDDAHGHDSVGEHDAMRRGLGSHCDGWKAADDNLMGW